MKYGIIGPRDFRYTLYTNQSYINAVLDKYAVGVTEIISGGGRGVEELVKNWANAVSKPIQMILPNMQLHGAKNAFVFRNQSILNEADVLLLFWDGFNQSTISPICEAMKTMKPVYMIPMQ